MAGEAATTTQTFDRTRTDLLSDPQLVALHQVLQAVARQSDPQAALTLVAEKARALTGATTVRRAWCAHDVGKAINPAACEGQIQGGFVQGMGYALTEALHWSEDGWLTTVTFADYKIPGVLDTPTDIHAMLLEEPEPSHPLGVKGIGEPAFVGVAAAIANAVCDATGARIRTLPLTPERVLAAIDQP